MRSLRGAFGVLFLFLAFTCVGQAKDPFPRIPKLSEVLERPGLFDALYEKDKDETVAIQGREVRIEIYGHRSWVLGDRGWPDLPAFASVSVKGGGSVRAPLERVTDPDLYVPKTSEPLLAIEDVDHNLGNCFNCEFFQVISLKDWNHPAHVGKVSRIYDQDGDGLDDLLALDVAFECVPWFSHAEGLAESIFWEVKGNRLVDSRKDHLAYYARELAEVANVLGAIEKQSDRSLIQEGPPEGHLYSILVEFLIYRGMGEETEGWKVLQRRLRVFSKDTFYVRGEPCPVIEVEDAVRLLLAQDLLRNDQAAKALKLCNEMLKDFPRDDDFWSIKGAALLALHQYREAAEAFERCAEYRTYGKAGALSDEVEALSKAGHYMEALRCHDRVVRMVDSDREFSAEMCQSAEIYLSMGKLEDALSACDQGISRDPKWQTCWHLKAKLLEKMGRDQEANEAYQKAWDLQEPDVKGVYEILRQYGF